MFSHIFINYDLCGIESNLSKCEVVLENDNPLEILISTKSKVSAIQHFNNYEFKLSKKSL